MITREILFTKGKIISCQCNSLQCKSNIYRKIMTTKAKHSVHLETNPHLNTIRMTNHSENPPFIAPSIFVEALARKM